MVSGSCIAGPSATTFRRLLHRRMFRALRIFVLLTVLVIVGGGAWLTKLRTTSWERPLRVADLPAGCPALVP